MTRQRHGRLRWTRAVLTGCALSMPMAAHALDEDTQVWVSQSAQHKITPRTTISIDLSQRFREQKVGGMFVLGRAILFRRIAPGLEVSAGVLGVDSEGGGEIRIEQGLTYTKGVFQLRSKLEERMLDGIDETQLRLRERAQLLLPLDKRWSMLASGELFFQLNRTGPNDVTGLNSLRTLIGVRRSFGKSWSASLVYLRQQAFRPAAIDRVTNAPSFSIAYNF